MSDLLIPNSDNERDTIVQLPVSDNNSSTGPNGLKGLRALGRPALQFPAAGAPEISMFS